MFEIAGCMCAAWRVSYARQATALFNHLLSSLSRAAECDAGPCVDSAAVFRPFMTIFVGRVSYCTWPITTMTRPRACWHGRCNLNRRTCLHECTLTSSARCVERPHSCPTIPCHPSCLIMRCPPRRWHLPCNGVNLWQLCRPHGQLRMSLLAAPGLRSTKAPVYPRRAGREKVVRRLVLSGTRIKAAINKILSRNHGGRSRNLKEIYRRPQFKLARPMPSQSRHPCLTFNTWELPQGALAHPLVQDNARRVLRHQALQHLRSKRPAEPPPRRMPHQPKQPRARSHRQRRQHCKRQTGRSWLKTQHLVSPTSRVKCPQMQAPRWMSV